MNLLVIFNALMTEKTINRAIKICVTPSTMSHSLRRFRDTFKR
jgi:hypothetical protein